MKTAQETRMTMLCAKILVKGLRVVIEDIDKEIYLLASSGEDTYQFPITKIIDKNNNLLIEYYQFLGFNIGFSDQAVSIDWITHS